MSDSQYPGFRHLATEDDDETRWRAEDAARRRAAAARDSRGASSRAERRRQDAEPAARSGTSPMIVGGGLALAAAIVFAAPLMLRELRSGPPVAPTASAPATTGLKIVRREPATRPITPLRTLPCYVNGVSVGALPLMDCAARNGVASGSLAEGPARAVIDPTRPAEPPFRVAQAPSAPAPTPAPRFVAPAPTPAQVAPALRMVRSPAAPARFAPPIRLAQAPPLRQVAAPLRLALASPRVSEPGPAVQYADRPVVAARPPAALAPREAVPDSDRTLAPSPEQSAQAAGDFYTALGHANGERAASLVVPEKRSRGPLSAPEIDRFFSSLDAPLRITDLRPINNRTVAVRYQYIDPNGVLCSGSSEVNTTVRDGRVLVQGVRAHSRC